MAALAAALPALFFLHGPAYCASPTSESEFKRSAVMLDVKSPPFGARGDGRTDDTSAIQNAINAAAPGDTVYFRPGTYLFAASLINTANVTLRGSNRHTTILKITRNESYGINLASGLHVQALTIRGNRNSSVKAHGFNGGNTTDAVIEDCIIEQWGAVAILGADNSHRNLIRDNIIRDNGSEGVYFGTGSDENSVEGNHIYRNLKNGIDINGSRNRIFNNLVHDIGKPGDQVDTAGIMVGNPPPRPSLDNLVQSNVIYNCATHGIILWATAQYTTITGNTCHNNAEYGIFLQKLGEQNICSHNLVVNNICRNNSKDGIVLQAAAHNIIDGNQSITNGQDGIAIDSTNGPAEQNIISGNICTTNKRYGIGIARGSRENLVSNNIAVANVLSNVSDNGDATTISGQADQKTGG